MEDVLSVLVVDEDRSRLLQAGWATGKLIGEEEEEVALVGEAVVDRGEYDDSEEEGREDELRRRGRRPLKRRTGEDWSEEEEGILY